MNLPNNRFQAISVSDLHLNHPKVSTRRMVDSLIKNITTSRTKHTTHLLCPGDVYDRPTQTDTEAGREISRFISFALDFSYKYNLVLIVLRGTGSHDGDQPGHFFTANEGRLNKADLHYIDKVSIFHDKYGLSWLGVPDEANPSALQTQAEIQSLLKENGLKQVHCAITHGLYNTHNLNGYVPDEAHDTAWYCSVVKYIIFNGHIHHPSQHDKLLTNGSHDRNRHGEEEAKGGWRVDIDVKTDEVSVEFRENKEAELFITYKVEADDIKKAFREVDKFLLNHPIVGGGYLRLSYNPELIINDLVRLLQDKYSPLIEFSTIKQDSKVKDNHLNDKVIEFDKIVTTPITSHTVKHLLEDKLKRDEVEDIDVYLSEFDAILQE